MREQFSSVNGIDLYSLTNPNLKSFCLSLYIRSGSLFEDSSDNGISHLFEHIVFRNLKRKYRSFYELLAMHGIDLCGCTYKDFIRFTINGPYYEFNFAIEILYGLFDEIQMSSDEFSKEKKRIKAEIREENERSTLDYFFNRIIWKNSEAEKTVLGYCRVIDGISVKRINAFRRKVLSRGNCFVYVTGNVSPDGLEELSRNMRKLDIYQENSGFTNTVTVNEDFFHRNGKVQVKNGYWHYIKVGFDIDCSKYPGGVYDLLYAVLFKGDKALVHYYLSEDNPILYSYDSALEQYDNIGNMNFSFEIDKNKLEEAVRIIVELLQAVKAGRFHFDANLKAELCNAEREWDNPDDLNWSMAYYNHVLKTQPLDYSDDCYGRFKVTKEQVMGAANEIFRCSNMTLSIKGDKKKININAIENILKTLD